MGIKQLRTSLHLTQVEVAIKCNVSLSTYRLWESGVTTPTIENMEKLKKVLKLGDKK